MINRLKSINWYRLNRSLHRDFGYFCIGFVLIYAISGIAVNHRDDWNPNFYVARDTIATPQVNWDTVNDNVLIQQVLEQVDGQFEVKASYWQSPSQFKVFLENDGNLSLNLSQNTIVFERIKARPVFQAFNRLHLNETHKSWIIVSDIFAGLLIFLALSALFMVKGKYSPWRKKSLWIIAGFVIPGVYIFI